jgi:Sap, sulfolipid-1-addressing protein
MNLNVLPLAITMMAGPQIMSALIFVTTKRAVATSAAFVAGVAIAATVGVAITTWLAGLLSLGDSSQANSTGKIIQYALVALLIAAAIKNWVKRETIEPPKWLGALMTAGPGKGFTTGLLLIGLFPSDVMVMLTVGVNVAQHHASFLSAWPFLVATVLIAALPLLGYLLFRNRAERIMPKVRDWMTSHSWLINIIVCLIFVVLILF